MPKATLDQWGESATFGSSKKGLSESLRICVSTFFSLLPIPRHPGRDSRRCIHPVIDIQSNVCGFFSFVSNPADQGAARQRLQICIETRNNKSEDFTTWYFRSSTKVLLAIFVRRKRTSCGDALARGAIMSIATEILGRRRDQFTSVARLIAALEWERATHEHILLRRYAVSTGSGDGLAECKQLLLPAHRANRRRFVEPVASTQRSCIQRRVSAV